MGEQNVKKYSIMALSKKFFGSRNQIKNQYQNGQVTNFFKRTYS